MNKEQKFMLQCIDIAQDLDGVINKHQEKSRDLGEKFGRGHVGMSIAILISKIQDEQNDLEVLQAVIDAYGVIMEICENNGDPSPDTSDVIH